MATGVPNIYFEPLPDLKQLQNRPVPNQAAQHTPLANEMHLRPKVSHVVRERAESDDDIDLDVTVVPRNSVQETASLEKLVSQCINLSLNIRFNKNFEICCKSLTDILSLCEYDNLKLG